MIVANNIKSTIPQTESVREYLKFVKEHFRSVDKSLAGTLMVELPTMKFDGSRSMQNYIIEMTNIVARLWTLVYLLKKSQDLRNMEVIPLTSWVKEMDSHKELKVDVSRFCRKKGHYQKDCQKCKA
ncbi:hypothetical protein KY284_026748 [Solanum tuberosum]|nr:hypothetical protein KY284_026748 [Solanum tuberosum]